MSAVQLRGGFPTIRRLTTSTAGAAVSIPFQVFYLILRNQSTADAVKVYMSQADMDADKNYITVPVVATVTPYGEWQGPVELDEKNPYLYVKAASNTPVLEIVGFQKRG